MEWSLPKIIAGGVATGVLAMVYIQLFFLHRRKFLALWSAAWVIYATRHIISVWLPSDFSSANLVVQVFSAMAGVGAFFLLWGTAQFVDKNAKAPLWPIPAILGGYIFALVGKQFGLPHMALIAPACLAVGLTYVHGGVKLLRAEGLDRWPRYAAGVVLVYWGIVQQIMVTVLVTPTPTTMAWGLLSGASTEVLAAVFLLVTFYQLIQHDLKTSQDKIISQRKRLEDALRHLPIPVYAFDKHGRLDFLNNALIELIGYEPDDIFSMQHAMAMLFGESGKKIQTLDAQALSKGMPLLLRDKEGRERNIILHGMGRTTPLDGWPYWGAIQDVTRLKRVESQLRRQLDFSRAVFDSATALTVVLDCQGRVIQFNKACEIATGKSADEIIGTYFWNNLCPPEKKAYFQERMKNISDLDFPGSGLHEWLKADGGRLFIQWSANAIRDENGQVEYIVSSGVDVTEQLRTQAALHRSEQFHRGVMENMPWGMLLFDYPRREVVYANPAAAGIMDLPGGASHQPQHLQDWANTRMGRLTPIIEDLEPGQTIRVQDVALLNRGGRPIRCDVSASVVEIEGSDKILCYLRDSRLRDEARERIRQVSASVAHNFNNLLQAITGNIQALGSLLEESQAGRQELKLVDNVAKAASNGQDTLRRLEAFLVSGVRDSGPGETLSMSEVARTALDLVETAIIREQGRTLETDLPNDLWVRGRRGELVEVILNLLNNAIEASGKIGRVRITGSVEDGMVRLDVSDNGPGIDPENRQRLFEPFFSTKGSRGKGLGLASCKSIIEAHGGAIEAHSPDGGGAVFSLRVPHVHPEPHPHLQHRDGHGAKPRTVLLVEDEALVAMGAEAVLTQAGHRVCHAANVAQARVAIKNSRPDVVICDQGLPDGSAWDVARALCADQSQDEPRTPFVVVTGWDLESKGMVPPPDIPEPDMIIRKPVARNELLRAVGI